MIELNKITEQSFLNRDNVEKLKAAGISFNDAVYGILLLAKGDYIVFLKDYPEALPTYSLTELFYKVCEYGGCEINGEKVTMWYMAKDAPFYMTGYETGSYENSKAPDELMTYAEYPIDSMVRLLIMCQENGIGCIGDVKAKSLKKLCYE